MSSKKIIARKPEWRIGDRWIYKTFRFGLSKIPLYGINTAQVIDQGKLLVKNNKFDSYKCSINSKLEGRIKQKSLSEICTTTQISYVKCADLAMIMNIAYEDTTINIGGEKRFIPILKIIMHVPPVAVFDFPLEIGKKWIRSFTPIGIVGPANWLEKLKITNFGKTTLKFECVKSENIRVPAGKYSTIVIEVKAKHPKIAKFLAGDKYRDYYSSKVGHLIRSEEIVGGKVIAKHELISFTRGK